MAVDGGCARRAGFRGGGAVYLGFRKDGPWNTGSDGSATEAGGDGAVPVCAESDVPRVLCGLGRAVGDLRPGECGRDCVGVCCAGSRGSVCGAVRAADAAKEVWPRLRGILPECTRLDSTDASVGEVRGL